MDAVILKTYTLIGRFARKMKIVDVYEEVKDIRLIRPDRTI